MFLQGAAGSRYSERTNPGPGAADRQEENAISILLGNYPKRAAWADAGGAAASADVPPGLPSSLLERRPDIREAEQFLVAANGANWPWPRPSSFRKSADGFRRRRFWAEAAAFFRPDEFALGIWSYGAQVSQPIFTGGALREICGWRNRSISRR